MNISDEIKLMEAHTLQENLKKLRNFHLFRECTFDDENMPQNAICNLIGNYVALETKEKGNIIEGYSSYVIKQDGNKFFILRLPEKDEDKKELLALFSASSIKVLNKLKITCTKINIIKAERNASLQKYWRDRIPILKKELEQSSSYFFYKEKENPKFPLIIDKTLEDYITVTKGMYEEQTEEGEIKNSLYSFYMIILRMFFEDTTGLNRQSIVNKVIVPISTITKLVPHDFTINKMLNHHRSKKNSLTKVNNNLIFNFNMEIVKKRRYMTVEYYNEDTDEEVSEDILYQRVYIPFSLLHHAFRSECFGRNGMPYFLLVMWGYHLYSDPKVCLKLSNLIKYSGINIKRGTKYTIKALERPLQYLKNIGIVKYYTPITKTAIKEDIAVTIKLNPIKDWVPPEKRKEKNTTEEITQEIIDEIDNALNELDEEDYKEENLFDDIYKDEFY